MGNLSIRVGQGYDLHRLVPGRKLILGGVTIPYEMGLLGHSDADVLFHATCDALLGAAGLGDIGRHFPDSDGRFKDMDSSLFIKETCGMIWQRGYQVGNLDTTIMAESPKLAPYTIKMKENLATLLNISSEAVNVKATTLEGVGPVGRGEAIAAMCIVYLIKSA